MGRIGVIQYCVFAALMGATAFGLQSVWGLLFLYWTILNFRTGHAFLLSSVSRHTDPVLFYLIQIAWAVLAVYMIGADFFPDYFYPYFYA